MYLDLGLIAVPCLFIIKRFKKYICMCVCEPVRVVNV